MRQRVSAGYFAVLRIPIVAGRTFESAEPRDRVVVVNEAFVRRFWPGENAVGKTILWQGAAHEVVGVARDAYVSDIESIEPLIYAPFDADTIPHVLVRDVGLRPSIASIATRIDPRVRTTVAPLSARLHRRLSLLRMGSAIAGGIGALALTLATLGLFGVFAYAVQQRTREIGIRIALGARAAQVFGTVLSTASRALVVGLALGALGAVAGSWLLRHRLHGVSPFDPLSYAAVGLLLVIAGFAATYLPARRAIRIDPTVALRYE